MQIKKELRQQLLTLRSEIPEKVRADLSAKISGNVLNYSKFKTAETVFCYINKENEISTRKIISECFSEGKKVAAPVCSGGDMKFCYIKSFDDLEKGNFSVLEPKTYCEKAIPDKKTICITPALCYNPKGYRIGYGKGFYDKFFEKNECVKIGLCYESFIRDFSPDSNDIPVDVIITEEKIIEL